QPFGTPTGWAAALPWGRAAAVRQSALRPPGTSRRQGGTRAPARRRAAFVSWLRLRMRRFSQRNEAGANPGRGRGRLRPGRKWLLVVATAADFTLKLRPL